MKRVAIFVILAALTVGFSSCSAVRHCQAPEVEMPGQIASGYTDSLTIADLIWWQFLRGFDVAPRHRADLGK